MEGQRVGAEKLKEPNQPWHWWIIFVEVQYAMKYARKSAGNKPNKVIDEFEDNNNNS